MTVKPLLPCVALVAICVGPTVAAQSNDLSLSMPSDAHTVVDRMADRNPTLRS
jgi:hypothetical protein